jgi:hypothetical protein
MPPTKQGQAPWWQLGRRDLLTGVAALSTLPLSAAMAGGMASSITDDDIMAWAKAMHALGVGDRYGYRMPGTASDHANANYIAGELRKLGLVDVMLEPVPVAIAFPDHWSLEIHLNGKREALPCSFLRYAGYTTPEGVTAELVHVGKGKAADFAAKDVRGKIVMVDVGLPGGAPRMGADYYTLDRNGTIPQDEANFAWPPANLAASYKLAVQHGAAGWIGILDLFGDDTAEYHHWYAGYELPAVTVSARTGDRLRQSLPPGTKATIKLTGTRGQGTSFNVYGTLPGRKRDGYVLVKSHHDGWATNEASGSAVTLAVARLLSDKAAARLDRDVLFFFRASHFGVGWTIFPDERAMSVADATRIYGLNPGWETFSSKLRDLLPRIIAANNIEMMGRQYRPAKPGSTGNGWEPTDLASIRYWGVTGPEGRANPVLLDSVRGAIDRHDLDRSRISNFLLGDGWDLTQHGIPLVNCISHNIYQFTPKDTPETIMQGKLLDTALAFADIVRAQDAAGAAALRPATYVPFPH